MQGARTHAVLAGSGIGFGLEWRKALGRALDGALEPLRGQPPDLLLLFASDSFAQDYADLVREAAERSEAREVAGCSASGVIGVDRELEGQPAVSALALRLPTDSLLSVEWVAQEEIQQLADEPGGWVRRLGLQPGACTGLVVLADPFSVRPELLIAGLEREYPGITVVGGLASGNHQARQTFVFHGGQVAGNGAVVIGLSGSVELRAVVSQGCEPLGEPWTVTDAQGHVLRTIGNRPAYQVLAETVEGLDEAERQRVARNLLVGLAMDEYRDEFRRGDFLIRNLMGVDRASGAMAVGAHLRVGQTLQFQVRDARAADEELRHLLSRAAQELPGPPAAALLFACNGRGAGLFGEPHHDARATRAMLGDPPLAGLFCNGEIGPVGDRTFLHGFTASLGLLVPREP